MPLRIQLVSSLIFPLFDYCVATLTDLTGQQKLKLKRLMNACVRFIFNVRRDEHISHHYNELGWLSADGRKAYVIYCFIFTVIRSGIPSYIVCNLHPLINPCLHSRSSPLDLVIPSSRTATYQRSFHSAGATMWNSFPDTVRKSSSLHEFKRRIFSHLQQPTHPVTIPILTITLSSTA